MGSHPSTRIFLERSFLKIFIHTADTYGQVNIHARTQIPISHTYIYTYVRTHAHYTCIHTYMYTYIHTCMYTYVRSQKHTYIHIHIHTYTYIHTYIHTDRQTDRDTGYLCPTMNLDCPKTCPRINGNRK